MDFDTYRDRMTEAHTQFTAAVMAVLNAHGQTQAIFNDLIRDVDTHLGELTKGVEALEKSSAELQESNAEFRRLILEQGEQIADLRRRKDEQ